MEAVENVGAKVVWIDMVVRRILNAKDHHKLVQNYKLNIGTDGRYVEAIGCYAEEAEAGRGQDGQPRDGSLLC